MKILLSITLVLFTFICKSETVTATNYAGGNGNISSPYEIETLAQLRKLSETPEDWGKNFALKANIDAEDTKTWNIINGSALGFSPIGDSERSGDRQEINFTGNFSGNGYIISNLYINRPEESYVGLFGLYSGNEMADIGLENCMINGGNCTGALVGATSSIISKCFSTGTVTGMEKCGGLLGYSSGTVTDCYSICTVYGTDDVGGFVGNNKGEIEDCFASAQFTDFSMMTTGGFVGTTNMNVINCKYNGATISRPTAIAFNANYPSIKALTQQEMFEKNQYSFDFENTWILATDKNGVYGLHLQWEYNIIATNSIGYGGHTTGSDKYSEGDLVKLTAEPYPGFKFTGWEANGSIVSSDAEYSFEYEPDQTMIYTAQFEQDYSFSGDGTKDNPYQIANFEDLQVLSFNKDLWDYEIYFRQTADIDASKSSTLFKSYYCYLGFYPIGGELPNLYIKKNFSAKYDGGGYTISNLYVNRKGQNGCGLFGHTQNTFISNLKLSECAITGKELVGGIVGLLQGNEVSNCSVSGNITGNTDIQSFPAMPENSSCGGIAGYAYATIIDCSSDVTVEARVSVGGIVGEYQGGGRIANCSAKGNLISNGYNERCVGGIAGYANNADISDCSSDCSVSTISCGGGIAGYIKKSEIQNCSSSGTVLCNYSGGGLIGRLYSDNTVSSSTASVEVKIKSDMKDVENMGGFAGDCTGGKCNFSNCEAKGTVKGIENTGGFIGQIKDDYKFTSCSSQMTSVVGNENTGGFVGELASYNGTISRCFANASVSGSDYTGGFIGWNSGNISESYCYGSVNGNFVSGGFIGYSSNGEISDCFSASAVNGSEKAGGFINDYRNTSFKNVYCIGSVAAGTGNYAFSTASADISDSYFDSSINPEMTASELETDQIKGISTELFADSATFSAWNFDSIWQIELIPEIDPAYRPYLQWMINNDSLTQTIKLAKGWNIISINRELSETEVATVFSDITDYIIEIKQVDQFYNPSYPEYLNNLTAIVPATAYLVNVSSAVDLTIQGELINSDDNSFELKKGWNLVGYPNAENVAVETALSGIVNNIEIVKTFSGIFIPNENTSNLNNFEPGKGYFIKVTKDCLLEWQ